MKGQIGGKGDVDFLQRAALTVITVESLKGQSKHRTNIAGSPEAPEMRVF